MIYEKNIVLSPPVIYKSIFLGGPIQGASDWQANVTDLLSNYQCIITNPRKKYVDSNFDYDGQVNWENYYLNRADIILFCIPEEDQHIEGRSYAQTTRFEIGEWISKIQNFPDKKIIIYIYDDFPGRKYIIKKANDYNIKNNIIVCQSLAEAVGKVENLICVKGE